MQSQHLSVVCIFMYILSLFIVPTHVVAGSDYGPQLDPVIVDEASSTLISITCPPSISYSCTENDTITTFAAFVAAGGSVNIPSECTVMEFEHTGDVFLGGNDCTLTYNRGYQIKTDCGSTFNCGQIVMIGDQTPPTITCPANITLSVSSGCDTIYTPVMATAEDDCGIDNISHNAPTVFPSGVTTVTYTATDMCGQTSTCTATVTVEDGGIPIVVCPGNLNVNCMASDAVPYASVDEFITAGGQVTDCTPVADLSISSQDNSDGESCPETVTRTYTITDQNNNTTTCNQTILVQNIVPPSFALPLDISGISCSDIDDLSITGNVSNVTPICGVAPTSSYSDSVTNNGGGSLTIERTFTVTGVCGVTASGIQTINVTDTERPTAICKDVTVYLDINGEATVVPDSLNNGSFDDCTPDNELIFTVSTGMFRCNDATFVSPQSIDLYVTDAAGLRDTCQSVVVVLDTLTPVITNPPNDTVTCISDIPDAFADMLQFQLAGGVLEDNCLGSLVFDSQTAITGTCPSMLTRTYEYSDIQGDSVGSAMHTIIVLDETSPVITCPGDITIAETDICDTLLNIMVTATDGCGTVSITNDLNADEGNISERFSGGTTPIQFIATDPCGNADTCTVTVTVLAPVKISFPALNFTCAAELPEYTNFQMFEDAGGSINENCGIDESTFNYEATFTITELDSCMATVKEVVTFGSGTDMCRDSVITTLIDSVGPEITCPGSPMIFAMQNPETCLPEVTSTPPAAKDNFGVVKEVMLSPVSMNLGESTAYWIATDACGNTDSCEVTVNIIDSTSPLFRIDTVEALCPVDVPQFSTINEFLNYSDKSIAEDCNLDSTSFAFVTDTIINGMTGKVYVLEDTLGNMSTVVHFYDLLDSEAPVFTPSTMSDQFDVADATSCVRTLSYTGPSSSDDHGVDTMFTLINGVLHTSFDITDYDFEIGTTAISHIVSDSCGRADTVSFEVTINDTSSPVFMMPDTSFFCVSMFPTFSNLAEFLAFSPNAVATDCSLDASSFEFLGNVLNGDGAVIGKRYKLCDDFENCSEITHNLSATDMDGPAFDSLPDPITPIACGDPLPAQEVLTVTDISGVQGIVLDTVPYIQNVCLDQEITYIWIATDNCGNESRDSLTFIQLRDDTPPIVDTYEDTIQVANAAGSCSGLLSELTALTFTDDCSGMDTVYTTNVLNTLPLGDNTIEWVGVDNCGNRDTIEQVVQVEDQEIPTLTCDSLVSINLTDEHSNLANVASFVKEYDDNCGVASIEARRVSEVCDDEFSDDFREVVRFCCADVGDTVMVEVRVTDDSGLVNTCLAGAVISDKLAPSVTYSLPDITVNCGYPIDTTDLSEFGVYVYDEADRDSIFIDAPAYDATDDYVGRDGLINENCSASQTDSVVVNIDNCNVGTIERYTVITDASGNKVTAKQTITVENYDPFYIDRNDENSPDDDIIWPETYEWDQCLNPAPDTTIAGAPVILNEDQCSQVVAIYSDLSFDIGNGGCSYIRRRWKVIDWCQYDNTQSPNPGEWTYNQDIYVRNTTSPEFTNMISVDSIVCAVGSSCEAPLNLSVSATDDCTDSNKLIYSYEIDVLNDGSTNYSGVGNTINSALLPIGTHKVTWSVRDLCGNDTQREDLYTVRDCKLPTIVCIDGLSIALGVDGTVTTWASDLVKEANDNCTADEDLKLSFSNDPDDFGKTFTTNDVGANEVNVWVTDLAGNQSYCTATVNIQDNSNLNGGNTTTIMGKVLSPQGIAIQESKVTILGAELADYDMSDQSGAYAFMDIEAETDIEVSVDREDDYITGVNTLDIVKIQRHILGIENLDSPYKMIAADATNDENITPADLLILRKLVLGLIDNLPDSKAWRFIEEESLDNDPWPFEEEAYVGHGEYVTDGDFVGVKVGDVDYSIENLLTKEITPRSAKYLGIVTPDQSFRTGQIKDVQLSLTKDFSLQGIQFTIKYNTNKLKFIGVNGAALDIESQHIGLHSDGEITLSFDSRSPLNLNELANLMTLRFEAVADGTLSDEIEINSNITSALAFDAEDEVYEVNLDYINNNFETFALKQNRPNPFFDQTTVEFVVPEEMEIEMLLFDATGKILDRSSLVYTAGVNTIVIDQKLEGKKGVFYLKMDAAEYSEVIKMIKLK